MLSFSHTGSRAAPTYRSRRARLRATGIHDYRALCAPRTVLVQWIRRIHAYIRKGWTHRHNPFPRFIALTLKTICSKHPHSDIAAWQHRRAELMMHEHMAQQAQAACRDLRKAGRQMQAGHAVILRTLKNCLAGQQLPEPRPYVYCQLTLQRA